jgi:hypothetical protein
METVKLIHQKNNPRWLPTDQPRNDIIEKKEIEKMQLQFLSKRMRSQQNQ